MQILLCGGAGFIGSHLLPRLSSVKGNRITVLDNFRTGRKAFIENGLKKENVSLIEGDLLDSELMKKATKGIDLVYNLAANADVRGGANNTRIDLEENTLTTCNLLEGMRINNVKKLVFFSSTQVYGEAKEIPTPEDYSPMLPTNLYGASKLSAEAFISAYCSCFNMTSYIFRLVNVVGLGGTHGVIGDFFEKLEKDKNRLEIFGNGKQLKSFVYIDDCLDAVDFVLKNAKEKINIYNIGSSDWIEISRLAKIVVGELKLKNVKFEYTGGERGWVGDVPKVMVSIEKIGKLGWKPKYNSEQAVRKTIGEIIECRR